MSAKTPARPVYVVPSARQPSGYLLKVMRDEHGWTQEKAAAQFGISLRAWQYYEADKRRVPRPIIRRAVEILNGREPHPNAEML